MQFFKIQTSTQNDMKMMSTPFIVVNLQMISLIFCSHWFSSDDARSRRFEPIQRPIVRLRGLGMETVIDRRGDGLYKYRGRNRIIATISMNHSMEIQFDLKLQLGDDKTQIMEKMPILFFECESAKMNIYVT